MSGEWWYQPASTLNEESTLVEVYDNDGFANEREICVASVADKVALFSGVSQIGSTTDNLTEQNKMDEDCRDQGLFSRQEQSALVLSNHQPAR